MAQLSDLRQQVKALYGLAFTTVEDPKFTDVILNMAINEAHRMIAGQALCYRKRFILDVPAISHGVSSVPLDCSIIRIDDYSVQVYLAGAWSLVQMRSEPQTLRALGDAPENWTGNNPCIGYLRHGESLDAQIYLDLAPGVAAGITGGLIVQGYIYPDLMTNDTDTPSIPPGLHLQLAKMAVYELAKIDVASGISPAAIAIWKKQSDDALIEVRRVLQGQITGNIRRMGIDPRGAN